MPVFAISYDLRDKKNYQAIHDAIKKHQCCKVLESFWLAEYQKDENSLRNELHKVLDKDDQLFVIKVTNNWASRNLSQVSDCLKRSLSLKI